MAESIFLSRRFPLLPKQPKPFMTPPIARPPGHFIQANFSFSPLSGETPLDVLFTDHSIGEPDPSSWEWDFGNGIGSKLQNPRIIYTEGGDYLITLTAANRYDSDTVMKKLSVLSVPGGLAPCEALVKIPFDDQYFWFPFPPPGSKSYAPHRDWQQDNIAGTLYCPSLYSQSIGTDEPLIAGTMNDYKITPLSDQSENRTIRITYHTTGPNPYFYVLNNDYAGFNPSATSKRAYFNITPNTEFFIFQSWAFEPEGWGDGEIFVECIDMIVRDWVTAGEAIDTVYYT